MCLVRLRITSPTDYTHTHRKCARALDAQINVHLNQQPFVNFIRIISFVRDTKAWKCTHEVKKLLKIAMAFYSSRVLFVTTWRDFSEYIVILNSYSIENSESFDIFYRISDEINYYVFTKISLNFLYNFLPVYVPVMLLFVSQYDLVSLSFHKEQHQLQPHAVVLATKQFVRKILHKASWRDLLQLNDTETEIFVCMYESVWATFFHDDLHIGILAGIPKDLSSFGWHANGRKRERKKLNKNATARKF